MFVWCDDAVVCMMQNVWFNVGKYEKREKNTPFHLWNNISLIQSVGKWQKDLWDVSEG